jgi:quinol monooxygenase YgiN
MIAGGYGEMLMVYIHIRHRVEDYARWREGYDNHTPARQAGGAVGEAQVMRNVEDPNEVIVLLGWSDLQKARAFIQSVSLKEAMQKAGVQGSPEIRLMEAAG